MKISKSYFGFEEKDPLSRMEIIDRQTVKNHRKFTSNRSFAKYKLPLESRSHRNCGQIDRSSFIAPKLCHLTNSKHSETAFNILQYQLKDRQAKQTHIRNLKLNLERRIQSAKAQKNDRLVALLTKESREIASLFV